MKQIMVLEIADLERLKGGETLTLTLPDGKSLMLAMEQRSGPASPEPKLGFPKEKMTNEEMLDAFRQAGKPLRRRDLKELFPQYSDYTIGNRVAYLTKIGALITEKVLIDGRDRFQWTLAELITKEAANGNGTH